MIGLALIVMNVLIGAKYTNHIINNLYDKKRIDKLSLIFALIGIGFALLGFAIEPLGVICGWIFGTMFGLIVCNVIVLNKIK